MQTHDSTDVRKPIGGEAIGHGWALWRPVPVSREQIRREAAKVTVVTPIPVERMTVPLTERRAA